MLSSVLAFGAALLSTSVAIAALWRRWRSSVKWSFVAGMLLFAVESALDGFTVRSTDPVRVDRLQTFALMIQALLPGTWLIFSLTYSRGDGLNSLKKWWWAVGAMFLLPVGLAVGFQPMLIEVNSEPGRVWWIKLGSVAKAVEILILVGTVFILMNLEATLRSALGTMRWRIKFLIVGLGVIFATRVYTSSQALLFSAKSLGLADIETAAVLIGCVLIGLAYMRSGFVEVDVYPSRAVLSSSITVLLVGGYLLFVGVFAEVISRFGGKGNVQVQAILVVLAAAVLGVLLFSDRLRQGIREFISHHFSRPRHDARRIWSLATSEMGNVLNPAGLCAAATKLISQTFEVLSVTVWLVDDMSRSLVPIATTSGQARVDEPGCPAAESIKAGLLAAGGPFDLERERSEWAEPLKTLVKSQFPNGGNRVCVPLFAGERWLGLAILADRVNGISYTVEEFDLLKCVGDQLAATLLNLRLTEDLMQSKELEAFQTMSTFFVHDLKNAAASLNLTLRNLPVHFDDPAFRADALRGIGNTVSRIDSMIERLSALRNKLELRREESDLNELVAETMERLGALPGVEMRRELGVLPKVHVDREQIRSVLTNLLLNARDAIDSAGWIAVVTASVDGKAVLSVADNGSGMSVQFMRESLFRPFQTTKNKGIGIGMFQSRKIVEAHGGGIVVESEAGKGTVFRVILPIAPKV